MDEEIHSYGSFPESVKYYMRSYTCTRCMKGKRVSIVSVWSCFWTFLRLGCFLVTLVAFTNLAIMVLLVFNCGNYWFLIDTTDR